ncbi:MAG: acyl-CoA desaturase [Phycisphaeraceae bacterium]|nr:MAG: acyl-CoA desaturase [Phycisphaeraceae bacterium]
MVWFDSTASASGAREPSRFVRAVRLLPFIAMHAGCLLVIWVGFSWWALAVAVGLYAVRMFAITAFYHRYFSHRSFRTSRPMQFVFALLGCSAVQRGPLWWAAHHREHHRHSDQEGDLHSPRLHGILWSHLLWFLQPENTGTNTKAVPDLIKYPELRWIDRYDGVVPLALALAMFALGWSIEALGGATSGLQMLAWGFFISTVACYHATYTINSLCHVWGRRRFNTNDDSRNNGVLALLTFGEGWHNNHHYFPGSARQGFYWWEFDLTYYVLWVMSKCRLVWDLNPVPERVYKNARGG